MPAPPSVSAEEAAVIEANAIALGVGVDVLMDNAGRAVAEEVLRHLASTSERVLVLMGPGNNGGDGAAATYHLRQYGVTVELWDVTGGSRHGPAALGAIDRAAREAPIRAGVPSVEEIRGFPLVVDALLGVGHGPPLRGTVREAVVAVGRSGVPVLAVDTPTGLGDPDGLRARWTVALTAPKAEVPPERAGETAVRDIGIPPAAWSETGPGEFLRFAPAAPHGPGARGGRVVVIGGGPYTGAPVLVGLGALRCGAERATVIVPEAAAPAVRALSMDLVVRTAGGDRFAPEFAEEIRDLLAGAPVAAAVIGPGAGAAPETVAFFRRFLALVDPALPIVVDADALRALGPADPGRATPRPILATPNAGEFRQLLERLVPGAESSAPDAAPRLAATIGATVVRKGAADVIADPDRSVTNRHHPPEQAVAGAGDVLSGALGALLARGIPPFGAARLGTYWVGEAGYRAAAVEGPGLLATDLLDALGPAGRAGLDRVRPAA